MRLPGLLLLFKLNEKEKEKASKSDVNKRYFLPYKGLFYFIFCLTVPFQFVRSVKNTSYTYTSL